MLIDGFEPMGVTQLGQDSVFMMPHLGVTSTVHPEAAMEVFEKDCLVRLGTCVALRGYSDEERKAADVTVTLPNGEEIQRELTYGSITKVPLSADAEATVTIDPTMSFDIGRGFGRPRTATVTGGVVGIILDARGRPLRLPEDDAARRARVLSWFRDLEMYPGIDKYLT